jgi:hypothetical protein
MSIRRTWTLEGGRQKVVATGAHGGAQQQVFEADTGHDFWTPELAPDGDLELEYGLVEVPELSTARFAGPDFTEGTGRPTIAEVGLYQVSIACAIIGGDDADEFSLQINGNNEWAYDDCRRGLRKQHYFDASRVRMGATMVAYYDENYLDGGSIFANASLYYNQSAAGTPTLASVTLIVNKLADSAEYLA